MFCKTSSLPLFGHIHIHSSGYPRRQPLWQDNMALTQQDIARLARLSGLQLDSHDPDRLVQELDRILGLIQELQAVDTQGVQPMAHPLEAHQTIALRLRDDIADPAQSADQRDACLKNAPAAHEGLFLVPTVIE